MFEIFHSKNIKNQCSHGVYRLALLSVFVRQISENAAPCINSRGREGMCSGRYDVSCGAGLTEEVTGDRGGWG